MNIETISEYVRLFNLEIIESGFKRDVQDYINSLPINQNNIVALRDIAEKISKKLNDIFNGDLPVALLEILPKSNQKPFTTTDFAQSMDDLINDTEIDQPRFFSKLQQILTQLNQKIQENKQVIDSIKDFIEPYTGVEKVHIAKENEAIISVILKDQKTITNLPEFTKNINAWNRILPIYHQVLTSHSPKDIEIIEVQNGSIDFVFSIDVNIALSLVELFKVGFKCYAAYLSYKKIIAPITDAYFGNQKLLKSEKAREEELLNNIALAITSKIEEQHKSSLKNDSKIDKNIEKKVEQITNLITSHIIKGNDIKLLAFPTNESETSVMIC
ncbi:MAG: hypothetical protein P4L45_17440 [Ignavibacteriaceae bacterium]|nr:hypothetical protein [Ignavibacteriaceae bacterium]